jgi:transposase
MGRPRGTTNYDNQVKMKAANLHIHAGYSYGDLTKFDEMPDSKSTISRWAKQGEGTGGVRWDKMKESLQKEAEAKKESRDMQLKQDALDHVLDTIGGRAVWAAELLEDQLAEEGDANPSVSKLKGMYEMIINLAHREHIHEIDDRLRDLAQEVGKIVGRYVQDDTQRRNIEAEVTRAFNDASNDIDTLLGID